MRKYIAFVLALVCVLSLVGCGKTTGSGDPVAGGADMPTVENDGVIQTEQTQQAQMEIPSMNAETITFHDKTFNKADLSQETIEWIEKYNALSESEQLAVSSIPSDLCELYGYGNAEDAPAGNTSSVNHETASKTPDETINDSDNNAWIVKIGHTVEKIGELSQKDISTISDILNSGNWINDVTKCASDCVITTADGEVYNYHSTCGTFNDNRNQRSMAVTDEEMRMINSILVQYGELEANDW